MAEETIEVGAVVKVDWLDDNPALQEQELLCETTTYGVVVAAEDEFLTVANRTNAVDEGEATIIATERVLRITSFGIDKR
jgi:hypothetical protein